MDDYPNVMDNYALDTCTYFPTEFSIWINEELGWIRDVYLEVENNHVNADWVKHEIMPEGTFSLFRAYYTFNSPTSHTEQARFYFQVKDQGYVSDSIYYNVENPFND